VKHLTKPHTLAEIGLSLQVVPSDGTEKLMERDRFLDAEQAMEMGLVDKVLTSRNEQDQALAPLEAATREKKDEPKKDGGSGKTDGSDNGDSPPPDSSPQTSSS